MHVYLLRGYDYIDDYDHDEHIYDDNHDEHDNPFYLYMVCRRKPFRRQQQCGLPDSA
jgi:hypothetical protein